MSCYLNLHHYPRSRMLGAAVEGRAPATKIAQRW